MVLYRVVYDETVIYLSIMDRAVADKLGGCVANVDSGNSRYKVTQSSSMCKLSGTALFFSLASTFLETAISASSRDYPFHIFYE